MDIVLEDEENSEYEAIFISKRTGLSGGWRAFALDHKLDDGDALVFELIEPTRFKVGLQLDSVLKCEMMINCSLVKDSIFLVHETGI